ncbi:MAG: hypothetical protein JXR86_06400 [Spirochaetales bacterium]|nr:hypothetical protein [Spirochaetales bacterium]
MKKQIVISVLSKDKPGIIADVANVIYELEGDLADMSQSVLNGFFSMIILANFDISISSEKISRKLNDLSSGPDLTCIVRETGDSPFQIREEEESDVYVVTAQGKNRTGLVAAMGSFCRDRNINIIGYVTKLSGDIYSMMLDIVLPEDLSPDSVHDELAAVAGKLGLAIVMQHKSLFKTVNEISLR